MSSGTLVPWLVPVITTAVAAPFLVLVFRRSRRPTANGKAHASLLILLGVGLLLAWAAAVLSRWAAGSTAAGCTAGLMLLLMLGAAVILGVWGLVEMSLHAGRYREGRGPAIVSLALVALWFSAAAIWAGLENTASRRDSPRSFSATPPAVVPKARPAERIFEALNCALRPPAAPWVELQGKVLNPSSTIEFLRASPALYAQLIAETAEGSIQDLPSLEAFAEANIRSGSQEVGFLKREALAVSGVEGRRIECRVRLNGQNLYYCIWLGAHNGYLWQLMIWGQESASVTVKKEADGIIAGFRVLDPDRRATGGEATAYRSARQGWSVAPPAGWRRWGSLFTDDAYAEYGAENGGGARMTVYAVAVPAVAPPMEATTRALLSFLGLPAPGAGADVRRSAAGGFERLDARMTSVVGGRERRYAVRLIQGRGGAWATAAWGAIETVTAETLDATLDTVTVDGPGAALDSTALSPRERAAQARFLNEVGVWHYEARDSARSSEAFLKAADLVPDDLVILLNAVRSLKDVGRPAEALKLIEARGAAAGPTDALRAERAALLLGEGSREAAFLAFAEYFAAGGEGAEAFDVYFAALEETDPARALREIDAVFAKRDRTRLAVWKAGVLVRLNRVDEAVAVLKPRVAGALFDAEAAHALLDVYETGERPAEAAAWAEAMISKGLDSARTWSARGRAESSLRWHKKAKASFERALEKAPADKGIRELLDHVSAMLGEGSNTDIKAPLEAVPLGAETVAPLPSADLLRPWRDHDAVWTRYGVALESWGLRSRRTTYIGLYIQNSRGVERFSALTFDFHPLAERIHVNRLDVLDEEGRLLSRGDPSEAYVLDTPGPRPASSRRVLNVPVSGLRPGCFLEAVVTIEERAAVSPGIFETFVFTSGQPCLRMLLFARAGEGGLRQVSSGGIEPRAVAGGLLWVREPVPPRPSEPLQPDGEVWEPTVWLGPPAATWASEGRSYLSDLKEKLEPDAASTAAALARVKDVEGARARALALAEWVRDDIAYQAVAFGRRGRIPQRADEVLRRRVGDCKDQALLLHQVLRAAGEPSFLVLARTEGELKEEVPTLDAFDHLIVKVPGLGFVDPTQKDLEVGWGTPSGLEGRAVLVLDPEGPRLERVPKAPAEARTAELVRTLRLAAAGHADVKETLTFRGALAAELRGDLRGVRPESRAALLRHRIGHATAEIREVTIDGLEHPGRPLKLELSYRLPKLFQEIEGRRAGRLPAPWERESLALTPVESRRTPFEIRGGAAWKVSVEVLAEPGWTLAAEGPSAGGEEGRWVSWKAAWVEEPGRLRLNGTWTLRDGRGTAADYAACRESVEKALSAIERAVVATPAGRR